MGLFYFDETANEKQVNGFGNVLMPGPGPDSQLIIVPGAPIWFTANPATVAEMDLTSKAVYGQVTWTPPVLDDRLHLTAGLRYTDDSKDVALLVRGGSALATPLASDASANHTDWTAALQYDWTEDFSTYIRAATAYRTGGASIRDFQFRSFGPDETLNIEAGLKSFLWDRRLLLNASVYKLEWKDVQFDFANPALTTQSIAINAGDADIRGIELETTLLAAEGLRLSLGYQYMDADLPPQLNPFSGATENFNMPLTPKHAGTAAIDYTVPGIDFGTLAVHLDANARSKTYSSALAQISRSRFLVNGRVTLGDLQIGEGGSFKISGWIRNIFDRSDFVFSAPGAGGEALAYGEPRAYGVSLQYDFRQ